MQYVNYVKDLSPNMLFDLYKISNYLNIEKLYTLISAKIGCNIKKTAALDLESMLMTKKAWSDHMKYIKKNPFPFGFNRNESINKVNKNESNDKVNKNESNDMVVNQVSFIDTIL